MNKIFLITLITGVSLMGCNSKKTDTTSPSGNAIRVCRAVPDSTVAKSELDYDANESLWKLNGQLFSGYAFTQYPDGMLKEKFGVLNGRKQSLAIHWYADGHYKRVAHYQYGKLNGDKKIWSSGTPHILLSHLKYVAGKPHGVQHVWYPTGELFKRMHMNMGKEDGLQQAFRKNGKLYANYEAKNGRIFGLKRAQLCYALNDEKIAYND